MRLRTEEQIPIFLLSLEDLMCCQRHLSLAFLQSESGVDEKFCCGKAKHSHGIDCAASGCYGLPPGGFLLCSFPLLLAFWIPGLSIPL